MADKNNINAAELYKKYFPEGWEKDAPSKRTQRRKDLIALKKENPKAFEALKKHVQNNKAASKIMAGMEQIVEKENQEKAKAKATASREYMNATIRRLNAAKAGPERTRVLAELRAQDPNTYAAIKKQYPNVNYDYAGAEKITPAQIKRYKAKEAHVAKAKEVAAGLSSAYNRGKRYEYASAELKTLYEKDRDTYNALVEGIRNNTIETSSYMVAQYVKDHAAAMEKQAKEQQKTIARSSVELKDLSSDAINHLFELEAITVDGYTKKDLKEGKVSTREIYDAIRDREHQGTRVKCVRPIKFADLSKTELARLAQNGKVKIATYTDKDGKKKWSYHALTPEDKAKGDKYWIEHNKKQRPELFGKTKQEENTANNDAAKEKPAETRAEESNSGGGSRSAGSRAGRSGDVEGFSEEMNRALKTAPTALKEFMEATLGTEFPPEMIRHAKDGSEYIPTSKLGSWMRDNLTAEQKAKLETFVNSDDLAKATDMINNGQSYKEYLAGISNQSQKDGTQNAATAATNTREPTVEQRMKEQEEYLKSLGVDTRPKGERTVEQRMQDQAEYLKSLGVDVRPKGERAAEQQKTVTEENPQVKADKEKARELLKKDPKKFKEVLEKNKQIGHEDIVKIMEEVEKETKAETKETAQEDKKKAVELEEAKAKKTRQVVKEVAEKAKKQRRSLGEKMKTAARNAGRWVSDRATDAYNSVAPKRVKVDASNSAQTVYTLSGFEGRDATNTGKLANGTYTFKKDEKGNDIVMYKANAKAQEVVLEGADVKALHEAMAQAAKQHPVKTAQKSKGKENA